MQHALLHEAWSGRGFSFIILPKNYHNSDQNLMGQMYVGDTIFYAWEYGTVFI